jgi:uncharacterized protein
MGAQADEGWPIGPGTPAETTGQRAAIVDLLAVSAAICAAWAISRLWLYPWLGVPNNAPVILRPIAGFLTAFYCLRRRGQSFAELGFRRPPSWFRAALAAVALYLVQMGASEWLSPWLAEVLEAESQPSFMLYIRGNVVAALGWIAIGWLVGGFAEELLFRGFLLQRSSQACAGGALGLSVGIVAQALLFGSLHLYAGPFAFVHSALFAVLSGVAYLLARQNLWPLIVVHGIWNMVGLYGVYAS